MSDKNSVKEEELEVKSGLEVEDLDTEVVKSVTNEDNIDEVMEDDSLDNIETSVVVKKMNKHNEALSLIAKAKEIVKEADEQTESCRLLLEGDLKEYEYANESLKTNGMDACISLMYKMNSIEEDPNSESDAILFDPKEEVEPMYIKDLSSGKFTGFLYSILGGVATVGGVFAYAMQKLGIPFNFEKLPTLETINSILGWVGTQVGKANDVTTGALVVGGLSVVVMATIYALRTSIKGSKNLAFASKQLEDAKNYTEQKENCKKEMDKVDAHMRDTLEMLKTYEVLFNEQKGKLERIVYIEGLNEDGISYHEKSKFEIAQTNKLLNAIQRFISTPMVKEGKLSEDSVASLETTKKELDEVLKSLYC